MMRKLSMNFNESAVSDYDDDSSNEWHSNPLLLEVLSNSRFLSQRI